MVGVFSFLLSKESEKLSINNGQGTDKSERFGLSCPQGSEAQDQ